MLISAAWSARWLRVLKALELAIFGGSPKKLLPPRRPGLLSETRALRPVTNLVAVLRPVAFYFRQPAQLRFPVPSSSLRAPCECTAGYLVFLGIACNCFPHVVFVFSHPAVGYIHYFLDG